LLTASRNSEGKSILSLIAVAPSYNLSKWADINKDLDYEENEIQKKRFQERIVDKILLRLNQK